LKITEKIRTARELYLNRNAELRSDPLISSQLCELSARTEASRRASLESGVAEACRRCDEIEGGSCCGAGIEERYTTELLLINLILGAELPEARYSVEGCYFLHSRGCILFARDILCINYLCSRLQRELRHGDILSLQDATGKEMEAVFVLHNSIRNFLKK